MENHKACMNKICFIMCSNNEQLAKECLLYINQLEIPKGFQVETRVITGAASMAQGYNQAMRESDAKYKVYLHQDVLLIDRKLISNMLSLFESNPQIGMLGVVGVTRLPLNGCPWSEGRDSYIGEIYADLVDSKNHCIFSKIQGEYEEAVVLDGLFMATQYDLSWREDLFRGWDFYDCSQSLEFWKAGYKVAVPHMEEPWCLHDNDILNLEHYETWRTVFEKEYGDFYKDWDKNKDMTKQTRKKVIYQKFDHSKTMLPFPYPPVTQEKGADYICFTDDQTVCSKFWKVQYIEDLENFLPEDSLSDYEEQYELSSDQIQIGDIFTQGKEWEKVVTVPPLTEIPKVVFDPKKLVTTADEKGNYKYKKNPQYTNGKYNGRRLLLTIGVPVSNQIDTIDRCLLHIKPLLEQLDAELLVVDTGSTDGTVNVCRTYGARIVQFPWCNNMSAARNTGIWHALGEWYLSIDDDEWFEDVEEILTFFKNGYYKKFDVATYIQRNYQMYSGLVYHDIHTPRMARITPELHFEGRIHDALIVSDTSKCCQLSSYTHHYGFVSDDEKKAAQKYVRNVSILLFDLYEYPMNLRYNFQLANELKCQAYTDEALAWLFRGISMEKELSDEYSGRLHAVNLLSCLHNNRDKRLFNYAKQMQERYALTEAEKAFLAYDMAELAELYQMPDEEVLKYCSRYEKHRKRYEKNPYDSRQRAFLGLHTCTNDVYIVNSHVIAFCAYVRKGEEEKARMELGKIVPNKILDHRRQFFEHVMRAGDKTCQMALCRLMPQQWEEWREELLSAALVSLSDDEFMDRQQKRLSAILQKYDVPWLKEYFWNSYAQFHDCLKKHLFAYAMACRPLSASVQELYVCGYLLKVRYFKEGKKEKDKKLFCQYAKVMGAFAVSYYHPALLEQADCQAVPADIRAVCAIAKVLQDPKKSSKNLRLLRDAASLFAGFKSEIQYLLEQLSLQEEGKKHCQTTQDEMVILAQKLKKQIAGLLVDGCIQEAVPILMELSEYFPNDSEIVAMRKKAGL